MDSQEIKEKIGQQIREMGFTVDLTNPENVLSIEIRDKCYVYEKTIQGPGGMPLGTAGFVASQLRSREDLIAAWLFMKRGAEIIVIGKPDKKLLATLKKWAIGRKIRVVGSSKEARRKGAIAFVASGAKQKDMVVFNPLVGFGKNDVDDLYKKIIK
jgi:adenylyl- and sulfurtransferase ThiI